jgi:phosphatidylserine decarboxylase
MIDLRAKEWLNERDEDFKRVVMQKPPAAVYDPILLSGQTVNIDGKPYKIKDVETLSVPRSQKRPYTSEFIVSIY